MMNVRGGCGQLLFMLIFLIGEPRYLIVISYNRLAQQNKQDRTVKDGSNRKRRDWYTRQSLVCLLIDEYYYM